MTSAPMPHARQIRSMPDPASAISTVCGGITSYFGVLCSGSTTSRRPRRGLPSMIQRSALRNSAEMTYFPAEPMPDIPEAGDTKPRVGIDTPERIHRNDRPRPEHCRDAANNRGTEGGRLCRSRRRHWVSFVPLTRARGRIETPGSSPLKDDLITVIATSDEHAIPRQRAEARSNIAAFRAY